MSTQLAGIRHRSRKTPMQARKVGAAFLASGGAAAAVREPFPGMNLGGATSRAESVKSGTVSAAIHAARRSRGVSRTAAAR